MSFPNETLLPLEIWTTRAQKHAEWVSPLADAFLKRRGVGQTHAVHDFLFTYYSCSPSKLKQWIPSIQEALEVNDSVLDSFPWLNEYWFQRDGNLLRLRRDRIHDNILKSVRFIFELCDQILKRAPRFGCFGLHEWAMVYRLSAEQIRHQRHRLRLSPTELAQFVESQTICCSHYDAYRFFTEEARPLNTLNPRFETRLEMEQSGCLHANMDIYKWAIKLWPWIGSDFLAKAFFFAREGRELDMRASPYDLKEDGYLPICIETESGRREYQREQQLLAERSIALRKELRDFCELIYGAALGEFR